MLDRREKKRNADARIRYFVTSYDNEYNRKSELRIIHLTQVVYVSSSKNALPPTHRKDHLTLTPSRIGRLIV